MINLKAALSQGGGLVAAGGMLVGSIIGNSADPYDRLQNEISSPSVPAVIEICPPGWEDVSSTDLHIVVFACEQGDWLVYLQPDGSFSHALKDGASAFTTEALEVPGWLY